MKQWLLDLFSSKSNVSSMRVMSMVCIVSAVGLGWYGIMSGSDLYALSALCGTFLAAGFTGKAVQKGMEPKKPGADPEPAS